MKDVSARMDDESGLDPSVDDADRARHTGSVGLRAAVVVLPRWKMLLLVPLLAGAGALAVTYAMQPMFTARTTILPPQSQQSAGAAALASLGALAGLGSAAARTPADQYASLMQSDTVRNRIVDEFKLMTVYGTSSRTDARGVLEQNTRISVGKKDGLITVEVDDHAPERAAAIANAHIANLQRLSADIALTEAQQRRAFFESQVKQTREHLNAAQVELQATGYSAGALRSEPRAAADNYARLRADITNAEVRLQALRSTLTDSAPEVGNQVAVVTALRGQLGRLEAVLPAGNSSDYLGKYREFKYQEALYDLFSKQYEVARLDESKEGTLLQVIDPAMAPEHKSRPRRSAIAVATALVAEVLLLLALMVRQGWRRVRADPLNAPQLARLNQAFGRR